MDLNKLIEELYLTNNITLADIPKVDLYMDQVIQLFESTYDPTKRNKDEKILTKTMINNYAKGKLLLPIKNKKYSREHIILLSIIYQLKGGLSINDIKLSLDPLNAQITTDVHFPLEDLYQSILHLQTENAKQFKDDLQQKMETVAAEQQAVGTSPEMEKILLLSSLIHMSNLYRRTAEKLVDDLTSVGK